MAANNLHRGPYMDTMTMEKGNFDSQKLCLFRLRDLSLQPCWGCKGVLAWIKVWALGLGSGMIYCRQKQILVDRTEAK